jgi:hypothetical protein
MSNKLESILEMTRTKFKKILSTIRSSLRSLNVRGQPRNYLTNMNRITISDRAHLFITLSWLRQYITDNLLSAFFGISNFALNRIIKRTLIALDQSIPDIIWTTDDEFNELCVKFRHVVPDKFANLIVVVDGTEIPIRRPKDNEIQKQFYSTKKKQYSVTILLIVSLDGRILYVSNPQIGSLDQRHWNRL